jgi:glycosyltransferase involved in cell wall biosynthesis
MPKISVILPFHNASPYIQQSIQSILQQSFKDLELICIDDGSTDQSLLIVEQLQSTDARIKIIEQTTKQGIARSLNAAIAIAQGEFIARMDADDVALPNRMLKQHDFLVSHPEIGIVGSQVHFIDGAGRYLYHSGLATLPAALQFISLFTAPFVHSAVMGRTSLFQQFSYSQAPRHFNLEDFELWNRMLWNGVKAINLNSPLLNYRLHLKNITVTNNTNRIKDASSFCQQQLVHRLGLKYTLQQVYAIRGKTPASIPSVKQEYSKMLDLYNEQYSLNTEEIAIYLERILAEISFRNLKSFRFFNKTLRHISRSKYSRIYMQRTVKTYLRKRYRL